MKLDIHERALHHPELKEIEKLHEALSHMKYHYWLEHSLFTWQWWLLLSATILPWIIFGKMVDRSRFFDILTFGYWWSMVAVVLDGFGITMNVWGYPIKLVYLFSPLVPADLSVIPITFMFLYQYLGKWKHFLIGTVITAFVFSFLIEPLFIKYGMFKLYKGELQWTHTTSFIAFIVLSIAIRYFHITIRKKIQKP